MLRSVGVGVPQRETMLATSRPGGRAALQSSATKVRRARPDSSSTPRTSVTALEHPAHNTAFPNADKIKSTATRAVAF